MTSRMMNALLSGALAAACPLTFADQQEKESTISAEGTALPADSAPVATDLQKASMFEAGDGQVERVGRTSSDSMHPKGKTKTQVADDYKINTFKSDY